MGQKQELCQQYFTGERALFKANNLVIRDTVFGDGESPLKESSHIELYNSTFQWKYPLWYCNDIKVSDCLWNETARAGVWYSNHVQIRNTMIDAPKNFRRCKDLNLLGVTLPKAEETLWDCKNVTLSDVVANGDYFAMNCENVKVMNFNLTGNYSFDGASNVEIHNAKLISKDAFWNSDNVTVYDSFISGEYLGWNAKNLTFINCTIESLQGLCYIDNLVMKNCKLVNTTLAFEYSDVEADIVSHIDSIKNPQSGIITAESIGELIIEKDKVDPGKTKIICKDIHKETA